MNAWKITTTIDLVSEEFSISFPQVLGRSFCREKGHSEHATCDIRTCVLPGSTMKVTAKNIQTLNVMIVIWLLNYLIVSCDVSRSRKTSQIYMLVNLDGYNIIKEIN